MPVVSVIVPIYNSEKYLSRCIDSILNQTYRDFELILINDGSSDDSGILCNEYAAKDNRIKVVHKENAGVSSARNIGVGMATGTYIMFVDSDDCIESEMIYEMLEKADCTDLVISSIKMVYETYEDNYIVDEGKYEPRELIEEYCNGKIPKICICGPCCKLFRTDIIKNNHIQFDLEMYLGEDTCFNMQYIAKCKTVVTMKCVYYNYMRENDLSLFSKFRDYYYDNIRKVYYQTMLTAKELDCSRKTYDEILKSYLKELILNVKKAIVTAEKCVCIDYMKKISKDEVMRENIKLVKETYLKYLMGKLIQLKCYNLVYYIWKLGNKIKH